MKEIEEQKEQSINKFRDQKQKYSSVRGRGLRVKGIVALGDECMIGLRVTVEGRVGLRVGGRVGLRVEGIVGLRVEGFTGAMQGRIAL